MSLLVQPQNPAELGDRLRDAYVVTAEFLSDIISQTCLAVPLVLLYGLSILSCRWVEKARAKREAEEEAELAAGGKAAPGE